jgi:plasmid stabilization system protein ParE
LKTVELHRLADKEFDRAGDYYKRNAGIEDAEHFTDEIERALDMLGENPLIGTPTRWGVVRSFTIRRFPYNLFYADQPTRVYVLAIAHHRRRPGYWVRRLK